MPDSEIKPSDDDTFQESTGDRLVCHLWKCQACCVSEECPQVPVVFYDWSTDHSGGAKSFSWIWKHDHNLGKETTQLHVLFHDEMIWNSGPYVSIFSVSSSTYLGIVVTYSFLYREK